MPGVSQKFFEKELFEFDLLIVYLFTYTFGKCSLTASGYARCQRYPGEAGQNLCSPPLCILVDKDGICENK